MCYVSGGNRSTNDPRHQHPRNPADWCQFCWQPDINEKRLMRWTRLLHGLFVALLFPDYRGRGHLRSAAAPLSVSRLCRPTYAPPPRRRWDPATTRSDEEPPACCRARIRRKHIQFFADIARLCNMKFFARLFLSNRICSHYLVSRQPTPSAEPLSAVSCVRFLSAAET